MYLNVLNKWKSIVQFCYKQAIVNMCPDLLIDIMRSKDGFKDTCTLKIL